MDLTRFNLDYEVLTLSNGTLVGYRHEDFPDAVIRTRINEGTLSEPKPGLTHVTEHLFYRNDPDFKRKHFRITGRPNPNAYTSMEDIHVTSRMPVSDVEAYFDLWIPALQRRAYDQVQFDASLREVATEVREKDNPDTLDSYTRMIRREYIFPGHPLGEDREDAEAVMSISPDDVAAYKERIINSSNVIFTVVGDIGRDSLLASLERHAAGFSPGEDGRRVYDDVPPLVPAALARKADSLSYPVYVRAFQSPGLADPDWEYIKMSLEYLAGGLSSRLGEVLREQRQLVYAMDYTRSQASLNPGVISINLARFRRSDLDRIGALMDTEFERLRQGEVDGELLDLVKIGYIKRFWANKFQNPRDQAGEIDLRISKGYPISVGDQARMWYEANPSDIARAAQKIFTNYVGLLMHP